MKKLILSIFIITNIAFGHARTAPDKSYSAEPDTVAAESAVTSFTDLDELVVEGRTQRVIEHGVEYIPSRRTKKGAMDAISLLRLMAVPQLDVDPVSNSVRMIGNREVSIFIDYAPANPQELAGLRPEDVLSVEVLQYPHDPRFRGAPYVINYIMQKYEWGGYTKISGNLTPWSLLKGGGSVYSKYASDIWTFDAAIGASGTRNTNPGGDTDETFRDFYLDGRQVPTLERRTRNAENLVKTNDQWGMLRSVYGFKGKYLSHTLYFSRTATPLSLTANTVSFTDQLLPSTSSLTEENTTNLSPAIYGYYYFILPKNTTLTVDWNFIYNRNVRNSIYTLGHLAPIANNNREDVYSPEVTLYFTKNFPRNNIFRLMLSTMNSIFHTRYAGSYEGLQKLISSGNMLFAEYMKSWSFGLSLYSRLGVSCVYSSLNGVKERQQWDPRLGMQLNYMISQSHSVSLEGWYGNSHPHASFNNSAIVRDNELLWIEGNPDLRNVIFHLVKAGYNFMPGNKFSLAVIAQYSGNPDMITARYLAVPEYDGIVRRYTNSSHPHDWTLDVTGTLKLLGNSLVLQAGGTAKRTVITGVNPYKLNNISGKLTANYFIGSFSLSGYYISPMKSVDVVLPRYYTLRSTYGLSATYSAGDLKVSLSTANWWNRNRRYISFSTGHYSLSGWEWREGSAFNVKLALSYTLTYGKKVNRNDEVQTDATIHSAILK